MTARSTIRLMLSSLIFAAGGTALAESPSASLEIRCTEACTVMVLDAPEAGVYVVQRTAAGEDWNRYTRDDIKQLRFIGSEGDDVLIVESQAPMSIEAYGRGGNDYLSGSQPSDILVGGVGDDVIDAGRAGELCSIDADAEGERCERG